MSAHRIPSLRRRLPISVALLIMATAAVVPSTIAVSIALAGMTGLVLLRVSMGHIAAPRRVFGDSRWNPPSERTSNRGGSHATRAA